MPTTRPALVVFQGGISLSASPLERLVSEAQTAATLDLLDAAATTGTFEKAFLVSEQPALADAARSIVGSRLSLHVESGQHKTQNAKHGAPPGNKTQPQGAPFHFGERLLALCKAHGLDRVVYVGGGSLPLGAAGVLKDLALAVSGEGLCVTANSLYSADLVAFYPASALERIALPASDNDLAWLLHFRAGLPFAPIPRSLATQFDLDTPTDLAALWWSAQTAPLAGMAGPRLTAAVSRVPQDLPHLAARIERAYAVMATRRADVLVAGRVSSWVWRRLETNLPCQTRIVSEERGMRAGGRDERGEVRSLLGLYTDLAGIEGLMDGLRQVCDAAFLDTRVLFAHRKLKPSPNDRFASDAFLPDLITEPWVRAFTEVAAAAPIPIVLGGHSLVSGGVWALSERVRSSSSAG